MSVEWVQEVTADRGDWHCAVAFGCWMRVQPGKPWIPPPMDDEEWEARTDGWTWSVHKSGERIVRGWCKTRDEATTAAELAAQAQS
jgi:hypothetical protein